MRFPGLDPRAIYQVAPLVLGAAPATIADQAPPWYTGGGVQLSGALLGEVGLPMPLLAPQQGLILEFQVVDAL